MQRPAQRRRERGATRCTLHACRQSNVWHRPRAEVGEPTRWKSRAEQREGSARTLLLARAQSHAKSPKRARSGCQHSCRVHPTAADMEAVAHQRACAARLDLQRQTSSSLPCSASRPQAHFVAQKASAFGRGAHAAFDGGCRDRRRVHACQSALGGRSGVSVQALDASWPSDYEAQAKKKLQEERMAADRLRIGARGADCLYDWLHTNSTNHGSANSAFGADRCPAMGVSLELLLFPATRDLGVRELWAVPRKALHPARPRGAHGAWSRRGTPLCQSWKKQTQASARACVMFGPRPPALWPPFRRVLF